MKKVLCMALVALMTAGTVSVYACGGKCSGDKDKKDKATAEKTTAATQQAEASTAS